MNGAVQVESAAALALLRSPRRSGKQVTRRYRTPVRRSEQDAYVECILLGTGLRGRAASRATSRRPTGASSNIEPRARPPERNTNSTKLRAAEDYLNVCHSCFCTRSKLEGVRVTDRFIVQCSWGGASCAVCYWFVTFVCIHSCQVKSRHYINKRNRIPITGFLTCHELT